MADRIREFLEVMLKLHDGMRLEERFRDVMEKVKFYTGASDNEIDVYYDPEKDAVEARISLDLDKKTIRTLETLARIITKKRVSLFSKPELIVIDRTDRSDVPNPFSVIVRPIDGDTMVIYIGLEKMEHAVYIIQELSIDEP